MIRQVDSSLPTRGEIAQPELSSDEAKEIRPPGAEMADQDITRDTKAFTAAIRNRVFAFLRGLVTGEFESAVAQLNSSLTPEGQPWTAGRLQQALEPIWPA